MLRTTFPSKPEQSGRRTAMWALLAGILLGGFALSGSAADGTEPLVFTVDGGYRGRVFGCDCPGGQAGGITRRAAVLQELFGEAIPAGLDAGGILDLDPDGGRVRSRCAIIGLGRQGIKVLGVTPRDLFYGSDFLETTARTAEIALVSANLANSADSSTLFPRWSSFYYQGLKLAVTSLSDFQPGRRFSGVAGWIVLPVDSVIASLEQSLPADADLRILLTDISEQKLRDLAAAHASFDLIITSSRQFYSANPLLVGNTNIIHPRTEGRALDWIEISFDVDLATNITFHSLPLPESRRADRKSEKWLEDCLKTPEN